MKFYAFVKILKRPLKSFLAFTGLRAADKTLRWRKTLGGRLVVGSGTRTYHATLVVREPAGCELSIGSDSNVECTLVMEAENAQITIGSRTHIGGDTLLDSTCGIAVGDDVLIAFGVLILDHDSHSLHFEERKDDVRDWMAGKKSWDHVNRAPVRIGNKCWVGARSIVLKGVSIGEGAVVGAGSVVTRDVPPWCLVAGNPATIVRRLEMKSHGTSRPILAHELDDRPSRFS